MYDGLNLSSQSLRIQNFQGYLLNLFFWNCEKIHIELF